MFQSFLKIYTRAILLGLCIPLVGCGAPSATNVGYSYAPPKPKNIKKINISQGDKTASLPKKQPAQLFRKRTQKKRITRSHTSKRSVFGPSLNKIRAVKLVNSYRIKNNLPPLRYSERLEKAAQLHSKDMAKNDKISHIGSNGSDPWDRIVSFGYPPDMATENIGGGVSKFRELFDLWKASKQHNANLLVPDATDMGLALVHNQDAKIKTYWTLVIAKLGS